VLGVLNRVAVYRLWQAPFVERKLAPFYAHSQIASVRRVLDVGCGPGTNAKHFDRADYLGVDLNPEYIAYARRRFGDRFRVADVTRDLPADAGAFDCILVNSLFHHLDTSGTQRVLAALAGLLTPGGSVHILDLVMPSRPSIARLLARCDRGDYPRPLEEWRRLFTAFFRSEVFEPYSYGALGVPLWNMVYFKGTNLP